MKENVVDRYAKAALARDRRRPRWQKMAGNFGFGFLFLGFLANLALYFVITVFRIEIPYLYDPGWLTYAVLSCVTGWSWRRHGRHFSEA